MGPAVAVAAGLQWDESSHGVVAQLVICESAVFSGTASAWMALECRHAGESLGLTPRSRTAMGWRIVEQGAEHPPGGPLARPPRRRRWQRRCPACADLGPLIETWTGPVAQPLEVTRRSRQRWPRRSRRCALVARRRRHRRRVRAPATLPGRRVPSRPWSAVYMTRSGEGAEALVSDRLAAAGAVLADVPEIRREALEWFVPGGRGWSRIGRPAAPTGTAVAVMNGDALTLSLLAAGH